MNSSVLQIRRKIPGPSQDVVVEMHKRCKFDTFCALMARLQNDVSTYFFESNDQQKLWLHIYWKVCLRLAGPGCLPNDTLLARKTAQCACL